VLADVGRFYRGKIALRSSRAATERVTMSITPEQIATMIDALPQIADVTLTSDADGTILIDARHGASSE